MMKSMMIEIMQLPHNGLHSTGTNMAEAVKTLQKALCKAKMLITTIRCVFRQ